MRPPSSAMHVPHVAAHSEIIIALRTVHERRQSRTNIIFTETIHVSRAIAIVFEIGPDGIKVSFLCGDSNMKWQGHCQPS